MRLIATVLLTAIQAVRACMLAAGTAALIAVAFVRGSPSPEWFGPVRQLSLTVGPVLLWILAGYLLVYWATTRRPLSRPSPITPSPQPIGPAVSADVRQLQAMTSVPTATLSIRFASPAYRVYVSTPWILAAFRVGYTDYAMTPLPDARVRDARFSFSGNDGMLRQQPEGTPLLKVRREGSPWPSRPYVITEAGSGRVLAILEPAGVDRNVPDGNRNSVAHIEELKGT